MADPHFSGLGIGALGRWAVRFRWWVVAFWLVLAVAAAVLSSSLPRLLRGEVGSVPGSVSEQVMRSLSEDFAFPYAHFLVVTLDGSRARVGELEKTSERLQETLRHAPDVRDVMLLPSQDDRKQALAVGLTAANLQQEERAVPVIRRLVAETVPAESGLEARTTGHAALNTDMVELGSKQTATSEQLVMPFVLLALLLAFGALGAALSPLVTGAAAVLLAMGLLTLIARSMHLSVYASNVATMLGLGLGIDYSLFMVGRIREEARQGAEPVEAVRRAITHAAPAILVSVGTVLIGMAAMATVQVPETFGMGVGGAVVAVASMLASVTLLPALAAILGPWLDAPRAISRRLTGEGQRRWWEERARWVVRHPRASLVVSVLFLVALSVPLRGFQFGFPDPSFAPRSLESVQGLRQIQQMGMGGALVPVQILVSTPHDEPVLAPSRLAALSKIAKELEAHPNVAQVLSIANTGDKLLPLITGLAFFGSEGTLDLLPKEARWFVSKDGRSTLIQVVPKSELRYGAVRELARELRGKTWTELPGLEDATIRIGGPAAVEVDFIDLSAASLPRLALFIAIATLLMLFWMTRSYLIPVKAVLTNGLTVCAAMGATLFFAQSPAFAPWIGLAEPVTSVPAVYPIMVFCLLFGLSMDYEVILMSRIAEAHHDGKSDAEAVVAGLGTSGGVITSAAVIMAIVFLGFAFTELIPVKLLGMALAIGVILDATVTRLFLIPAAMVLLGKWNWVPGSKRS